MGEGGSTEVQPTIIAGEKLLVNVCDLQLEQYF